MPIPQADQRMFDQEPKAHLETPVHIDRCRSPQLNKTICRCRCGCSCFQSRDANESERERSASISPIRGRSPTVREIVSNYNPLESRPAPRVTNAHINAEERDSINGQEGVAGYQLEEEVGDLGVHTRRSIEHDLARHGHSHRDWPASPTESMLVETSSGEHSLASSGYLMPLTRSPSSLFGHTGGPFDAGDDGIAAPQPLIMTPLFLNYERRFCRNLEFGQGFLQMHYPMTLDIDEEEFGEYDF